MDIDLRLVLLLIGIIVVVAIIWDGYRKKRIKAEKMAVFNQNNLDELLETRDGSGFDLTGVGLTRIIGDDDIGEMDEPLVASRTEGTHFDTETMTASRHNEPQNTVDSSTADAEPELIVSISIIARSEDGFVGEKLLHCMLSRGLRFGDMDIFHRYKNTAGDGPVQFSLANAVKPGTFKLDDMGSFQTRGVTLFMMLPGPKEPIKSYQLMLDTAEHLSNELDGQLVDSSRSILTKQTIQHFKEQIQDFERRHYSNKQS